MIETFWSKLWELSNSVRESKGHPCATIPESWITYGDDPPPDTQDLIRLLNSLGIELGTKESEAAAKLAVEYSRKHRAANW